MDDGSRIDAVTYLDRFFDVVREEARANPAFSARLIEALGGEVVFPDNQRAALINPLKLSAKSDETLRNASSGMTASDLKAVLKAHNLASAIDTKGKSQADLVDLLVARARSRLAERSS